MQIGHAGSDPWAEGDAKMSVFELGGTWRMGSQDEVSVVQLPMVIGGTSP